MKKIDKIIKEISNLTIEESVEMISILEKKWNIKNSNFIEGEKNIIDKNKAKENNKFEVIVQEIGNKKLNLIKAIKKITGKNLMQSKELIDKLPAILKKNINKEEAEKISKIINESGAKSIIKKLNL